MTAGHRPPGDRRPAGGARPAPSRGGAGRTDPPDSMADRPVVGPPREWTVTGLCAIKTGPLTSAPYVGDVPEPPATVAIEVTAEARGAGIIRFRVHPAAAGNWPVGHRFDLIARTGP